MGRKTNPFSEIVEDFDLNEGLMVEPLLVADDFYSNRFSSAVVSTMQNLTERSLS